MSPDGLPKPTHKASTDNSPLVMDGPSFGALASQPLAAANGRVAIIVHNSIYDAVLPSIADLAADLAADGWSAVIYRYIAGGPASIRTYLNSLYYSAEGLKGAILIGEIPCVIYEMMQTWDNTKWEYEDFPCDLYYMDLNGTWSDTLTDRGVQPNNGKYDTRTGDLALEIWVGRIKTTDLPALGTETGLISSYVDRARAYRAKPLLTDLYAVAYDDDDWSYMVSSDRSYLESVFGTGNSVGIGDPETTTVGDYRTNRLPRSTRWYLVRSHGYSGGHGFYRAGKSVFNYVYPADYLSIDPPASFYSLFVCSACDYTANGYLGGSMTFNPEASTVLSIGSTKTGGMWSDASFYNGMSQGKCVGEAFRNWFNQVQSAYPTYTPPWWYGMVLIGDPTLRPNPATYPTYHHLTLGASPPAGGTVTPAGDRIYPDGQVVSVTASASAAYRFDHWSGPVSDPLSPSTAVSVTSDAEVTANFVLASVASAKRTPDGSDVVVRSGVVTLAEPEAFYVEDADRASGIRVVMPGFSLTVGDRVDVTGTIRTDASRRERYIEASAAVRTGAAQIRPLCTALRSLGGGDWAYDLQSGSGQKGVDGGWGLNSIGLLMKTTGVAQPADDGSFYLCDGPDQIRVMLADGIVAPIKGTFASVVGVVGCEPSGSSIRPVLRVRNRTDIVTF